MIDIGNEAEILKRTDEAFKKYRRKRQGFERDAYQNMLFLHAIQWIKYDARENRFRKRRLKDWVPMPVTNLFRSTGDRIAAVLSRIEPNWTYAPGSESEADMAAAKVADKIEPIIAEENGIETIREQNARWLTYTGNVFPLSGVEEIPNYQLRAMEAEASKMDPNDPNNYLMLMDLRMQIESAKPAYRQYTELLTLFEVHCDLTIENIKDQQEILLVNLRDNEWIKKKYGIEVQTEREVESGLRYLESLAYLTSEMGLMDERSGRDENIPRSATKRLNIRPCDDYPEGLYAVSAGDKVLEAAVLPKSGDERQTPFVPIQHMKFDAVPGCFFGVSPMTDLIPKQVQLNKLDSLIELMTMRMSSPIWLVPDGTVVHSWDVGAPGSQLRYSQIGDKAAKPDRIPGEQIPTTLIQWRSTIAQDFEELGSMFDAMKGKQPYSGAPASLVDQLVEQGMSRFGPGFRNIAEGYRLWMKDQMEFFRTYGSNPRLLPILGENAQWKIQKFSNADFQGAVNIRIESESSVPRNEAAEGAKVIAAVQSQLIDTTDPLIRYEVLKKLHLGHMMNLMEEDVLSAVKEHEALMQMDPAMMQQAEMMGQSMPSPITVKPFLDNHQIHIQKHRSFAMSEEGQPYLQIMLQHLAQHNMFMDAELNGTPPAEPGKPGQAGATPEQQEALAPQGQVGAAMPG